MLSFHNQSNDHFLSNGALISKRNALTLCWDINTDVSPPECVKRAVDKYIRVGNVDLKEGGAKYNFTVVYGESRGLPRNEWKYYFLIVQTTTDVVLSPTVAPVKVQYAVGRTQPGVVVSWGSTEDGNLLRYTNVTISDVNFCHEYIKDDVDLDALMPICGEPLKGSTEFERSQFGAPLLWEGTLIGLYIGWNAVLYSHTGVFEFLAHFSDPMGVVEH